MITWEKKQEYTKVAVVFCAPSVRQYGRHFFLFELKVLLKSFVTGEKLSDEEVEQVMQGQEDSQGNVNYEEFVRVVMNG